MMIYVCKHGVESGIIIEGSVDYDREEYIARAHTMHCQACADEGVAALLARLANITPTLKEPT